jgi:ribosomal protein S18 acetylase RimI-like enzyme
MEIRPATIQDIPQIALLWQELSQMHAAMEPIWQLEQNAVERHEEHLKVMMAKDSYIIIVAEKQNKIVGFSTLSLGKRPDVFLKKLSGSIQDTCVKSEYRKKGIGKELTLRLIKIAKEKGVEMLTLGVAIDNEVGNIFWKEMGFRPNLTQMAMYLD